MNIKPPALPAKKQAVFHIPFLGIDLYDGMAMDLHALTYAEPLLEEIGELRSSVEFYKCRCEELQRWQSSMRDPERTVVCDILANGQTLPASHAGSRYGAMTIPD